MSRLPSDTSSPFPFVHEIPAPSPRREIVAGLIAAGELVAISGNPKAGKSALAVHLAACVSAGQSFLGRSVEQAEVLYIAAEKHVALLRRIMAVVEGRRLPIRLAGRSLPLDDGEAVRELIDSLRKAGARPGLIIIDTLAACMGSLDENSARDMGQAIETFNAFKDAFSDAALVIIHHLSRGTGGKAMNMRGSTALLGGVELELRIDGSAVRTLTIEHANNIAEGGSLNFRLEELPGGTIAARPAEPIERPQPPLSAAHQAILNMLPDGLSDRQEMLKLARSQGLVGNSKDKETQAEAFRVALVALQTSGAITYDNSTITRRTENLPPYVPPESPLAQGGGASTQTPPPKSPLFKRGLGKGGGGRAKKGAATKTSAQGGMPS